MTTLTLTRVLAAAPPSGAEAAVTESSAGGFWPIVSMLFFIAVFLGVVAWLIFSKKDRWARDASIPLSEAPVEPRSSAREEERSR